MTSPLIVEDRRRDLELRQVFDEVDARVQGIFDPSGTLDGPPLMHWAYRAVRESYPQLDATQVQVLMAALHRVYQARHERHARAPRRRQASVGPVQASVQVL